MRWLGIDHGAVRIGLAVSDESLSFAFPLQTLPNDPRTLEALRAIAQRERISGIVLGLPRNMNGTYGPAAVKVRDFGERLQTALPDLKIVFWDERLTTVEAQRALHLAGKKEKQSRKMIDQVAAQILLQNYLDRLQANVDQGS